MSKNSYTNFLKWTGVIALLSLPVVIFLTKLAKDGNGANPYHEEGNIFESELEG